MADVETTPAITAQGRYDVLTPRREPFLKRARDAAALTIPGLMPPLGSSGSTDLPQPFQSVGAEGVNNLASKLLLVLFPPGAPFFKLNLDDFVAEELAKKYTDPAQQAAAASDFDVALGKMERAIISEMESNGSRTVKFEAIKHLIVSGNALVQVMQDGTEKMYPLDRYVVKRDLSGNIMEIIVKEQLSKQSLPPQAKAMLSDHDGDEKKEEDKESDCSLYTWVQLQDNGTYKVHQEIEGKIIPGTIGSYPKGKTAWLPLRWNTVSGQDYGRGRVEEYIGDMRSCESGTQSILEFAAAAAKVLFLVDESGVTDKRVLQDANSGDIVTGNAKDVTVLMLEKNADFQVLSAVVSKVEGRLSKAFLNAGSVQRNAERVTAEEIRTMIGELETALGGTYAVLSAEFQRPLLVRVMFQMMKAKKLPTLPDGSVSPKIITGLEGLGRASDLQKLDSFVQGLAAEFGPEAVAEYVNVGAYAKQRGAALGIDTTGLLRSDDEVNAARAQQAQQKMVQAGLPSAIGAASKYNSEQTAQQQPAPQQ